MILGMIQARQGSTRLKAKCLKLIKGKTVLEHVYNRTNKSLVDNVVIVTTANSPNIIRLCEEKGWLYFVGDENDVIDRYYQYIKNKPEVKHIVRITSDLPVIDPQMISKCIIYHLKSGYDFTTNALLGNETWPDGMDVYIPTRETLIKSWKEATGKHREHVTTYPQENSDLFKIGHYASNEDLSNIRLTIDYPEDLKLIEKIYDGLYDKDNYFGLDKILAYLKENPDLLKINEKYKRNESYYNVG